MNKKNILVLSDSADDVVHFTRKNKTYLFTIEQVPPVDYKWDYFRGLYNKLHQQVDLSKIDLIIAEYVDSLALLYLIRSNGYNCPAILIPHTNPYPIDYLFLFILALHYRHPSDLVLCGSQNAVVAFKKCIGVNSLPICTFGIKKNCKAKIKKSEARKLLGLPLNKKTILFTARLMDDKGWEQLCEIKEQIQKIRSDILFVCTCTHIDSAYYNRIATKLIDMVLFYRLDQEELVNLYKSADLFISPATSCFETYGKSPLEAISYGLRVVLSRWDGFPYYIDSGNGQLVDVVYTDTPIGNPFQFAHVSIDNFVSSIISEINDEKLSTKTTKLPNWAFYDNNMLKYEELISTINCEKVQNRKSNDESLNLCSFSSEVKDIFDFYKIKTVIDLEKKIETLGFFGREIIGSEKLLREFHHSIFKTMDSVEENIL